MATIIVNEERCKSCGLCISNCPKNLLEFVEYNNKHGFKPVKLTDVGICNGCGTCYKMCPDCCIEVYRC